MIPFSSSLNANEQRELQNRMEKKQMKEFMNVGTDSQGVHGRRSTISN